MTKNEMLSLCKKACNELDDCEICPNKEKCDNISPGFRFAYLIEQAYGFSEEETIDFYNGFFPEKKVKKGNNKEKENKEIDMDDMVYISFESAKREFFKVNRKTVEFLKYLKERDIIDIEEFEVFDSLDDFLCSSFC